MAIFTFSNGKRSLNFKHRGVIVDSADTARSFAYSLIVCSLGARLLKQQGFLSYSVNFHSGLTFDMIFGEDEIIVILRKTFLFFL